MKSIKDYLNYFEKSDAPKWLKLYKKGQAFNAREFFSEKTVFYPGSGTDGHAVALFGGSHAAHSFIYADYGITDENILEELKSPTKGFQGYDLFEIFELKEKDIVPYGWRPTLAYDNLKNKIQKMSSFARANFAFLTILERKSLFDDRHGPQRLAILFLGADGIATYDAIYCQPDSYQSPFALLIEDYGFGGNYDSFGKNGLLEMTANSAKIFPKYILTNSIDRLWPAYMSLDLEPSIGGMHGNHRELYKKCQD